VYETDAPYDADADPRAKATWKRHRCLLVAIDGGTTELWRKGERMWDEYKKEHFKLKALLFVTITDLPGLGSLSGQVTKGYKGCVVCLDGTSAKFLKHSKKMVYMGHCRFLPSMHPYRKNKKSLLQIDLSLSPLSLP
jgi:hypothetical protein